MRRPTVKTHNGAVEELLRHPALWRARESSDGGPDDRLKTLPTGFATLDECLPGGGWPSGALTEILHDISGIGELSLLLPAMAQVIRDGYWLVWIMPPYRIAAPAMHAHGIDPSRVLVVRDCTRDESLWACEQALRSSACGIVLIWSQMLQAGDAANSRGVARGLRRLQLAARSGQTLAVLFRPVVARRSPSAAVLRMQLHAREDGLDVELFKRRGGQPVNTRVQTSAQAMWTTK